MIGSHNTFTYYDCLYDEMSVSSIIKAKFYNSKLIKKFWKCQDVNADEQHDTYNIRFFDIRMRFDIDISNTSIYICHGKADVMKWDNSQMFLEFIKAIEEEFPDVKFRIVLERYCDNVNHLERFEDLIYDVKKIDKTNALVFAIVKKPWTVVYAKENYEIIDKCCHLFMWDTEQSVWKNIKERLKNIKETFKNWCIKAYAENNNEPPTTEMINDPCKIYLYDYVDVYKPIILKSKQLSM